MNKFVGRDYEIKFPMDPDVILPDSLLVPNLDIFDTIVKSILKIFKKK